MNDNDLLHIQYYEYNLVNNISLKKLNSEEVAQAKNGQLDYTAFDPVTGIGITEAKGRRQSQEDRSDFCVTDELKDLADQQIKTIFLKAIATVQKKFGSSLNGGSTLVTAILRKDKLFIANVGDSNAILLLIDQHKNIICKRINILHNPSTPTEYEYIIINDGDIQHNRLGGMLAVSRAIGDNDFEQFGLRHTPDIFMIDLNNGTDENNNQIIEQGYKLCGLILSCDGLHEEDPALINMAVRIKNYLSENQFTEFSQIHNHLQQLSQTVVYGAYEDGSYDNLTAMIMPVDLNHSKVIVAMIADGHGGSKVAEALGKNFIPILISTVQQQDSND